MAANALPETKHTPGLVDRLYDRRGVCADGFPSTFCDPLSREAADALVAAKAENERLKAELRWLAIFADMRSQDDTKTFARVNRGALRTIRDRSIAALSEQEGK